MLFIVPLMMAFILFSLTVCRWLLYQGNILAAGRTATWLVAHANDPAAAGAKVTESDFAVKILKWHFVASGPNQGVVSIDAPLRSDGLLAPGQVKALITNMRELGDEKTQRQGDEKQPLVGNNHQSDITRIRDDEAEQKRKTNADMQQGGGLADSFITEAVNFLTKDFQRVEVKVHYWMPLLFNLSAFERLLGLEMDRGGTAPPGTEAAFNDMAPGAALGDYMLLSRGTHTTCIFPVLDPGQDGGVGEAIGNALTQMDSMLESVSKALDRSGDNDLYRPMKEMGGDKESEGEPDAVMQKEFYALLVYEWLDPLHKQAEPPPTPPNSLWWHSWL